MPKKTYRPADTYGTRDEFVAALRSFMSEGGSYWGAAATFELTVGSAAGYCRREHIPPTHPPPAFFRRRQTPKPPSPPVRPRPPEALARHSVPTCAYKYTDGRPCTNSRDEGSKFCAL